MRCRLDIACVAVALAAAGCSFGGPAATRGVATLDPKDPDADDAARAERRISAPMSVVLLHDTRLLIPLACWDPDAGQIVTGNGCLARVSETASAQLPDGTPLAAVGKHDQKLCGAGRAGRGADDTAVLDVEELGERMVAVFPDCAAAELAEVPQGPPQLLATKRDELLAFVARTVEERVDPSGLMVSQALVQDLDGDGIDEIAYAVVYTPGTWPPLFAGIVIERTDGSAPMALLPGLDWRSGAVSVEILATTDLDRDGVRELVVYERWVDGYYAEVRELGSEEPLYRIGCGES